MDNISKMLIEMYVKSRRKNETNISDIEFGGIYSRFKNPTENGILGIIYFKYTYTYDGYFRKNPDQSGDILIDITNGTKYLLDVFEGETKNMTAIDCMIREKSYGEFKCREKNIVYLSKDFTESEDTVLDVVRIEDNTLFILEVPSKIGLLFDPDYPLHTLLNEFPNMRLAKLFLEAYSRDKISKSLIDCMNRNFDEDWIASQRLLYEVGDEKLVIPEVDY